MSRFRSGRWILLFVLTISLFYWRIAFTKQFSILWQWESVTQSYSWYNFASQAVHKGILPVWDPYRFSGNTFIGEMQTGLFYPLKLVAYLMPLDSNGLFSERVYNELYVLTHIFAALFMFMLARYLRLSAFASFVAGLIFSLGGYLGNTAYPHTLDSGIWLPFVVLFFLKAAQDIPAKQAAFYASLSGLGVGMSILGGGIHIVIMEGIVIATLCLAGHERKPLRARAVVLAALVGVIGFMLGAVQMLPSMEYGPMSYRWIGGNAPIRFLQRVPYQYLGGIARFSPRSLFAFLLGSASPGDHSPSNYFGVLPFLLSIVGAWRCWREPRVKYFTVLAAGAYLYSWGEFSFLHGLLYLVPGLDIAREAGRFILLTHFSAAILGGYGIDHLFDQSNARDPRILAFLRWVKWLVVFLAGLLIVGSIQTVIGVDDWYFMSFFLIGTAYALLEVVARGYGSAAAKTALVFLLLWDLYEFNWTIRNKEFAQSRKEDHMEELMQTRKLVNLLKSQAGPFRIHFDAEFPPNLGDVYGIEMTGGMSATMLTDYVGYLGHEKMPQLLNVRYTLRRVDKPADRPPVFSDGVWNVFENPAFGDRAWIVHHVIVDPSKERPLKELRDPSFNPARTAILEIPLQEPVDTESDVPATRVQILRSELSSEEFRAQSNGPGLLVASEVFYPGWQAFVNGRSSPIYRVDGLLRGVVVPNGESIVRFDYRPFSLRAGAAMGLAAILATAILGAGIPIRKW